MSKNFRKSATGRAFALFTLRQLPLAFVAGVKIETLDDDKSAVSIKYGYRTKNPFKSMYFAAQAMAAEMSTAALALDQANAAKPAKVSMLVTNLKANFTKKAVGKIVFTCNQAAEMKDAFTKAQTLDEPQTITLISEGVDEDGDTVSTFELEWSIKFK